MLQIKRVFIGLIFGILLQSNLFAKEAEIDYETGLIVADGLELIKENCTVCHPGRFMVINGGDTKFWKAKVRLMQKGFGLWDLGKETESTIINYLSKHYPRKKKREKKEEDF